MGRFISTTGGRDVFLEDNDPKAQQLVASGDYKVAPGETLSIVDPYGHQSVVETGVVERDTARGIENKIESQDVVVKRAREKRLEGETSTLGALGRSAIGSASFGLTDKLFDDETLEADKLHHSTATLIGEGIGIVGSIALSPEAQLAKLFGAGAKTAAGVRELAVATDALTAEHVASSLGSTALLAGKGGAGVGEKALARSGRVLDEASLVRQGLTDIPQDLIGMDARSLRVAAAEERSALKLAAKTEEEALHAERVPLRKQMAEEVRALHAELMTERPIYKAVVGADVRKIEGVGDIASQLNKSYKSMRSTFDDAIGAAENTDNLLKPLRMRQQALESLQAKAPDLRAALQGDTRVLALDHVDTALEQTRAQIDRIKSISKYAPVSSEKLATLSSGVSPRLSAIEAAQDALAVAPEAGLLAKGAGNALFAGVTELARMIPGVGAMAPFVGKWASESVGKTFEHLAAAKTAVMDRSKRALTAFLDVSKSNPEKVVGAVGRTATAVLSSTQFAPNAAEPKGKDLASLYKARSTEMRSQTMYDAMGNTVIRPDARASIAKRLAPIAAVNPRLADQLETIAVRRAELISATMPRRPDSGGLQIGPDNWKPNELALRSWARTVRAAEDPGSVEEDLARGILTPEASNAYRSVYPERFAAMQSQIFQAAPMLSKSLSMNRKIALSIFTGVPLIPALQPNILAVLQGNFATEPGTNAGTQAQAAQPNFGALGSLKSTDKPTPAQQREAT